MSHVTHNSSGPIGSERTTRGICVQVTPTFLPEHSIPDERRYVFGYKVRISNQGERSAQLLSRHWEIIDANGDRHVVDGEGVIGNQPYLQPGEVFEYSSHCPLSTPWGTMEGTYQFTDDDGQTFDAIIGRFYLVSEPAQSR